jgi:hypothetical protein
MGGFIFFPMMPDDGPDSGSRSKRNPAFDARAADHSFFSDRVGTFFRLLREKYGKKTSPYETGVHGNTSTPEILPLCFCEIISIDKQ